MISCLLRALLLMVCLAEGVPTLAQPSAPTPQTARPPTLLRQMESEVADLVAQTQPCVVSIEGRITLLNLLFPPSVRSELIQEFSQLPAERRAELERNFSAIQESLKSTDKDKMYAMGPPQAGSGFLISGGFVVTTAEVVENMTEIAVVLSNGKRIRPLWVNVDPYSNIAVIKVEFPVSFGLAWGDSQRLRAGNFVIAIGNQAGFANSACLGMVSGLNRSGHSGSLRYHGLIQFQGVVGAGNSGSPLLNSQGEVVGMVVAAPAGEHEPLTVRRRSGGLAPPNSQDAPPVPNGDKRNTAILFLDGVANTGFAMPSQQLRPIIETLCKGANVKPMREGWLGIKLPQNADNDEMEAQIPVVYVDSPAAKAGLLPGDVIVGINGQPIKTLSGMKQAILNLKAGTKLQLDILRGNTQRRHTLITEPRPDPETLKQIPTRP